MNQVLVTILADSPIHHPTEPRTLRKGDLFRGDLQSDGYLRYAVDRLHRFGAGTVYLPARLFRVLAIASDSTAAPVAPVAVSGGAGDTDGSDKVETWRDRPAMLW